MHIPDDDEILRIFREVNQDKAFKALVKKYQERLYWHIRKILITHEDTDDVLQNTFIKAWKNLHNFKGDSSIYTWLYRIATNEAITAFNRNKKRYNIIMNEDYFGACQVFEGNAYFNGNEVDEKLQKAILTLPEKQRIVFNMKYFDDMKFEEISKILETSTGALKASYHHAVKKIEKYIQQV
ncbi:MAG: RNA polymerase sigma factor [bacterium]